MSSPDNRAAAESRPEPRRPDLSARCGRLQIAGWRDEERGWSFQLSRAYTNGDGETTYDELRLFPTDLPVVATLVQQMTGRTIEFRDGSSSD